MAIDEQLQLGRAKNALLFYFERHLSVPKIYLDADWADSKVDVLAINRDGVGDVHAVLMYPRRYTNEQLVDMAWEAQALAGSSEKLQSVPGQFKYIAAVDTSGFEETSAARVGYPSTFLEDSFSKDGLGRIGFFSVTTPVDSEPPVRLVLKPERFRANVGHMADEYILKHAADWEIRA